MKRLGMGLLAVALLAAAAAYSGVQQPPASFQIQTEERNPWTHLRLNNDPADFQFAIVSDRTGGHRARVFSLALEQLNLLQPEFVLSVGDLIEGYNEDTDKLADEWREFQSYIAKLQMPFFYVPGNHDLSNLVEEKLWKEMFGRRYYHFVYRNVLFLLLSSEDSPETKGGKLAPEQIKYVQGVLEDNRSVRWTVVLLHRPLWTDDLEKTGWLEVEKALHRRPYTVFAGHIHHYQKFVRNGQSYYQLATTGGASKMRGTRYGEFDHIVWVTMKKNGPVVANLLMDGILTEDLKKPASAETGVSTADRKPVFAVRGKVVFQGAPIPDAVVVFHARNHRLRPDGLVDADGSFALSTYTANDGAPAGEYTVTVVWRKPATNKNGRGPNLLPQRYANPKTSGLRCRSREEVNEANFIPEK